MVQLAASLLNADILHLQDEIDRIQSHVDRIHFDVMDGHFVPNLSFGFPILKQVAKATSLPMDAHLMISNPEKYIEQYARIVDTIYVHYEVTLSNTLDILQDIRFHGAKAGLVLNPETPVEGIGLYAKELTHVLIMSVHPGFGGQECIVKTLEKINQVKQLSEDIIVMVDGGMNEETAPIARSHGADIIVSGSYLLQSSDLEHTVHSLKG